MSGGPAFNSNPSLLRWSAEVERLHRQIEQIENAVFIAERSGDAHKLADLRIRLRCAAEELEQSKCSLLELECRHFGPAREPGPGKRARRW